MSSRFYQFFVIILLMEKNFSKNRIRDLREDRDLMQRDVAEAVGIDQRTLSNYETGKTNPDSYAIIRLAEYFGVTCDYLLGVADKNLRETQDVEQEIDDIKDRLDAIKRYLRKK